MEGTPKLLNYKIVQDSNINDDDQIEKYTGTVDWKYLEKHFQNGALVYVDEKLDIKKVAKVISEDNKDQVSLWLGSGDLIKPGEQHAQYWMESKTSFTALIVTPFVLIQENKHKE